MRPAVELRAEHRGCGVSAAVAPEREAVASVKQRFEEAEEPEPVASPKTEEAVRPRRQPAPKSSTSLLMRSRLPFICE